MLKFIYHPAVAHKIRKEIPDMPYDLITTTSMIVQYRRHKKKRIDKKWRKFTKPDPRIMMVEIEDLQFLLQPKRSER